MASHFTLDLPKNGFKIIQGKPDIWPRIQDAIPSVKEMDSTRIAITCGDEIYYEGVIPKDLLEHELIHVRQQTEDMPKSKWWDEYLSNPEFRYKQELEAYRRQLEFLGGIIKDRNRLHQIRVQIAQILSGDLYGNVRKYSQAYGDLR